MTSQKEYNMMFKLGAQFANGFNGTFSAAQKALAATQNEIRALNKQQADISSYQKQQQSVEAVTKKLSALQQQYNNIQKELQETEGFSSSLENKLIEKQAAIEKASVSLQTNTEKLNKMGSALRDGGIDTDNLANASKKLSSELDELVEQQKKVEEEIQNYGEKGVNSFAAVGDAMVAAGIAVGLKEIYDEYKKCVSLAADFESTMSTVKALSGASMSEISELTSMAKELGATTKFTAKESAEAMTYMAMAGWDAGQMMNGMDGVLQLAAASGEDLANVADIVTDNLTAFGLKASDAAHFSDVLATAATRANTNVAMMGETFKYAAPLAGALGYTIEDVATMVGLMANSGIKASQAGTALRTMFTELIEGATLSAAAFGEYTVETQNADGTMRELGGVISDLRAKFAEMTDAERMVNAEALVGTQAMTGFVTLMTSASTDFDTLANSIENSSGAAKRMADIKMDNLSGQLTLMNSAADALRTTIGESFNPELRALAKIGTDILTGINDFAAKHPAIVKSIIVMTAEVGAFLVVYKSYQAVKGTINTLTALSTVLKVKETAATAAQTAATEAETVAQTGLNVAMTANPIGLIITAVAGLTGGLIVLADWTKKTSMETSGLTAASREQYGELQQLNAEYENVCNLYGEFSEEARSLHGELVLLQEDYASNKRTIDEFNSVIKSTTSEYESFIAEHQRNISAINTEEDVLFALISKLESLEGQTVKTKSEKEQMLIIIDQLNDRLPQLGLSYDTLTNSLNTTAESIRSVVEAEIAKKKYEENYQSYYEAVEEEIKYNKLLEEAIENKTAAQKQYDMLMNSDQRKQMMEESKNIVGEAAGRQFASKWKSFSDQLSTLNSEINKHKKTQENLQKQYDDAVKTEKEMLEAMGIYSESIEQINEETVEAVENSEKFQTAILAVRTGLLEAGNAANLYDISSTDLQRCADEMSAYEESLVVAMKSVGNGFYSAEDAAKAYGISVDDLKTYSSIQATIDKINELSESYREVREAAENSIQRQYEIWDTAAVVIATDIGQINTALETQLSYWSDYNTDLNNLIARADDIDGLSEVIATFADGSADSVNAIAGMADASDSELRTMVDSWRKVQEQQREATDSLVELTTDYQDQIKELQDSLSDEVEGLNLDEEASLAAQATVDAYAAAIRDGTEDAVKAAERLSSLVATALQFKGTVSIDVIGNTSQSGSIDEWMSYEDAASAGYANIRTRAEFTRGNNQDKQNYGTYDAYLKAMQDQYNAYAKGTNGAEQRLALVGEEGPELVAFNGGEKVFTAKETVEIMRRADMEVQLFNAYAKGTDNADTELVTILPLLSNMMNAERSLNAAPLVAEYKGGDGVHITISPSFSVEGGNTEDIDSKMHEWSDTLVDMVMDAIEEAGIDSKRGVYA